MVECYFRSAHRLASVSKFNLLCAHIVPVYKQYARSYLEIGTWGGGGGGLKIFQIWYRGLTMRPQTRGSGSCPIRNFFSKPNRLDIWHFSGIILLYLLVINPLTAKLFNWNFQSLEVVSRWRDPQLWVSENYSDLTKWKSTNFNLADYCHFLSLTGLKADMWCAKKMQKRI